MTEKNLEDMERLLAVTLEGLWTDLIHEEREAYKHLKNIESSERSRRFLNEIRPFALELHDRLRDIEQSFTSELREVVIKYAHTSYLGLKMYINNILTSPDANFHVQ